MGMTTRLWMCATLVPLVACADGAPPTAGEPPGGFLADRYPCDQGIESDPAVVWHEDFEEGSVAAVVARYDDHKNPGGMALDSDRPATSCGAASMRLTAGGANSATDLYKRLPGADEWYVRWYVKYEPLVQWHHSGVWFGGYNPASNWPNPQAGVRPNGSDRVSFSIEPVWGRGAANPRFDFYNYWMTMHTCSACGGAYWGNALISRNGFTADDDQWMCMEVHAKLNTDMASDEGSVLEVWKNDTLVQTFPEAGEMGNWVQDHYCPAGADGEQCEYAPTAPGPLDLQFRTTTDLELNAFWPQNYISGGQAGSLWFDEMVIARERIGCLR